MPTRGEFLHRAGEAAGAPPRDEGSFGTNHMHMIPERRTSVRRQPRYRAAGRTRASAPPRSPHHHPRHPSRDRLLRDRGVYESADDVVVRSVVIVKGGGGERAAGSEG